MGLGLADGLASLGERDRERSSRVLELLFELKEVHRIYQEVLGGSYHPMFLRPD